MTIEFFVDKLGRTRPRGYKRPHKEARKVVPKRKFNLKTPKGWLGKRAYDMDVTHRQISNILRCSEGFVKNLMAPKGIKQIKPWMITALASELALTPEEQDLLLRMIEANERH